MDELFDATWHARALAGDADAVRRLARQMLGPLYRFCLHRVGGDPSLCEDVVQETMTRALERLEDYEPARAEGRIWGWLTGLARNEVRRALARSRGRTSLDSLLERADAELLEAFRRIESEPLNERELERRETHELVGLVLSQLPRHYQRALEAKYIEGRSVRHMARAADLSEEAAASQLARARRAFREAFEILARSMQAERERAWNEAKWGMEA